MNEYLVEYEMADFLGNVKTIGGRLEAAHLGEAIGKARQMIHERRAHGPGFLRFSDPEVRLCKINAFGS